MTKVDFTFKWDDKSRPVVVIDLHDGNPETLSRPELVNVLAGIHARALSDLYQAALNFLDNQEALEQKL